MKIDKLCKSFDQHMVLDHFSFSLSDGAVYALMGSSGRGKTTLLHILMGLQTADSGDITDFQNKKISTVFQENRLCEFLTAEENIKIVLPSSTSLDLSSILAEILPAEFLQQPVRTFSGGMKRRVAIARAMLVTSDLLIMDEPFSGLDEGTKEQVMRFILKYRSGRTLLFSTHDEEDVAAMDATLVTL